MENAMIDIVSSYVAPVIIFLVAMLVLAVFLKRCFIVCQSDEIIIISGLGSGRKKDAEDDSSGARIRHAGLVFVLPYFQTYRRLSLQPRSEDITLKDIPSGDFIGMNVTVNTTITVGNTPELMRRAAVYLGSDQDIKRLIGESITGVVRGLVANITVEKLINDKEEFQEKANKQLGEVLETYGLRLMRVNLKDIDDAKGSYLKSLSERATAAVVNTAMVDVAVQERTGATRLAEEKRQKSVAVANSTATERAELAAINSSNDIAVAETERTREVKMAEIAASTAIQTKTIENTQAIDLKRTDSEAVIAINEQETRILASKAQYRKDLATTTAEADIVEANTQAEALAAKQRVEEQRLRNEELTRINVGNEILIKNQETESAIIINEARAKADAILAEAEAEAKAVVLRGTAEAEVLTKVNEARNTAFRELIEACGGDPVAANSLLLTEKAEVLANVYAGALANIKFDKITMIGGGQGGEGAGIGNFIRDFANCLPGVHEFAKSSGVMLPALFGKEVSEMVKQPTEQVAEQVTEVQQVVETATPADEAEAQRKAEFRRDKRKQ